MRISDWSSDVCSSDLALQQQPWPGNVRELENCLWRLAVLAPGDTITAADVAQAQPAAATPQSAAGDHWSEALKHWAEGALAAGESGLPAHASAMLHRVLLQAAPPHSDGPRHRAPRRPGLGRNPLTRHPPTPSQK